MKLAHQIKISVFVKEDEDETLIVDKLKELIPFEDLDKEKIIINKTPTIGFEDKKIDILEVILKREKHVKTFLEYIMKKLSEEQKELLLKQVESRLDEENNFFFRLDKEKLLEGEYWVTDRGNCFHIKITIAAFPKTRENAKEVIQKII